ncbi:hypothetical protein D3C81_2192130 [compost metagenome]
MINGTGNPRKVIPYTLFAKPVVIVGYSIHPAKANANGILVLNFLAADHAIKNGKK